jgi:guanylate kinase
VSEEKLLIPACCEPMVIVISGPSAVGKDSVLQYMRSRDLPFHFVVTATSREPRPGEVHGKDYFFLSRQMFEKMIQQDELLEYAVVYDDYKGIPKQQVREALASGKDVLLRIDVQGAATVRKLCPDALLIFLTASEDDLRRRIRERKGHESPENIERRIATARDELQQIGLFDFVVHNPDGSLDDTVDTIQAIICSEHHRVNPRKVTL